MSCRLLGLAAAALALGACNTTNKNIGSEDPGMGEAVRYNAAVQTINPYPVYPEGGAEPGDSGVKGAEAVKRYRTDQVKDRHKANANPVGVSTTQGTSGGSGPR